MTAVTTTRLKAKNEQFNALLRAGSYSVIKLLSDDSNLIIFSILGFLRNQVYRRSGCTYSRGRINSPSKTRGTQGVSIPPHFT